MRIRSLEDLDAIRSRVRKHVEIRTPDADREIIVGMTAQGIEAGAQPVLEAVSRAVAEKGLEHVAVLQDAGIGIPGMEPVVAVVLPGHERITYAMVTPDMVPAIVTETLENGNVLEEYTAEHRTKSSADV